MDCPGETRCSAPEGTGAIAAEGAVAPAALPALPSEDPARTPSASTATPFAPRQVTVASAASTLQTRSDSDSALDGRTPPTARRRVQPAAQTRASARAAPDNVPPPPRSILSHGARRVNEASRPQRR